MEIKPYCRKRARPRNLVSREQPLQHHKANWDSKQTGKIGDFSSLNQEKNIPFCHKPLRKRRVIPKVENKRAMLDSENVQTSSVVKQNFDVSTVNGSKYPSLSRADFRTKFYS